MKNERFRMQLHGTAAYNLYATNPWGLPIPNTGLPYRALFCVPLTE